MYPEGYTTTQQRAIGVNSALMVFAVFMMAIRLYARLVISRAMGADDSKYSGSSRCWGLS
jgi:hypothetical protein